MAPVLMPKMSSSERSPSVMRAASSFVYGSPVFGFLIASNRCSALPAKPRSSSVGSDGAPSPRLSSNHASGGKPIALAIALIFS